MNSQKSKDKRQKPLSTLSASGLSTLNPKGGLIVGITGGIGSGKSTIARELAQRGYAVYDCDSEAKRIIAEDAHVQAAIRELLGNEAFENGPYNTAYVAKRVFAEPDLLAKLNAIVHPAVKADITYKHAKMRKCETLFVESAILFEAGLDSLCHKVFVIDAPEDVRIARTIMRDYNGEMTAQNINKVRARIKRQSVGTGESSVVQSIINDGTKPIEALADSILSEI